MGVREDDDENQKNHLCKVARLICEVESLKAENEALKTTVTLLNLKLDDKNHVAVQLDIDLQASKDEITSLKSNLECCSRNKQEITEACNDECNKTKEELRIKVESIEAMSSQIETLEKDLQATKNSEDELKKSNKELIEERKNLIDALRSKDKSTEKLSKDLNDSTVLRIETENRLQKIMRNLEVENERLRSETCKVEELKNECHALMTHLEKENLKKLALEKELEITGNRNRKLECDKNSYREKYLKTKENLTRKENRLVETSKRINEHLEIHKTTTNQLRTEITESNRLLQKEKQESLDSLRTFSSNLKLMFNSPIEGSNSTQRVNSTNSPDESNQIYKNILSKMKDFLLYHESFKHNQNLMNHNLITQTEHLTNEVKKSKSELLKKEETIQWLRKDSTEKVEESKKIITKLLNELHDVEKLSKEVKLQYEMKFNECAKQMKVLRYESDKKDSTVSRMTEKYKTEMRTMSDEREILSAQVRREREEIFILKKKIRNIEQDIDDLKELLKESHTREEQSRNMLKEKHETLETVTRQLETSKCLLSASKQDVEALKERYSATKLLLQTSEMLKNQMQPLNSQAPKNNNNNNNNPTTPVHEKSNLLINIT